MESDFIKEINYSWTDDHSNEEYHSHKDHCSASTLKAFKQSPDHAVNKERKETDAFVIGSAYHSHVLEPEKFNDEFFVMDDREIIDKLMTGQFLDDKDQPIFAKSPRSTKIFKEWQQEEISKAGDKQVINGETFDVIDQMRKKLYRHNYARHLVKKGVAERSHYVEILTNTGQVIKVRIRPDKINIDKRICTDLKSCMDASVQGFGRDAARLSYHIQAAFYCDILEHIYTPGLPWTFIFVAQEKNKPFAFNLFESSPQFISQGRYEYEMLLLLWQYCQDNNIYPGYQVWCENKYGIQELSLPPYAVGEINWFIHK